MEHENCRYCTGEEDVAIKVADLEASVLYLTKDQGYRGRCILALKEHKTEFFQLDDAGRAAFAKDLSRASKAVFGAVSPDKLNYAVFGDLYPHFHIHLVPKFKDGKTWGGPFEPALQADAAAPEKELASLAGEIKKRL
jgi:diadenosine tetraphosphate (Ap4A) HIT family hydrolase